MIKSMQNRTNDYKRLLLAAVLIVAAGRAKPARASALITRALCDGDSCHRHYYTSAPVPLLLRLLQAAGVVQPLVVGTPPAALTTSAGAASSGGPGGKCDDAGALRRQDALRGLLRFVREKENYAISRSRGLRAVLAQWLKATTSMDPLESGLTRGDSEAIDAVLRAEGESAELTPPGQFFQELIGVLERLIGSCGPPSDKSQ